MLCDIILTFNLIKSTLKMQVMSCLTLRNSQKSDLSLYVAQQMQVMSNLTIYNGSCLM
jgi:hypothetical protein